jgi:hypothetical protein
VKWRAPHALRSFGVSLSVGDFNEDGYEDLAVGVPRYDSYVTDAGAVVLFYGGADRLSTADSRISIVRQ